MSSIKRADWNIDQKAGDTKHLLQSGTIQNSMLADNRHRQHMVNGVHVQYHDELELFMEVCGDRLGLSSRDIRIKSNIKKN